MKVGQKVLLCMFSTLMLSILMWCQGLHIDQTFLPRFSFTCFRLILQLCHFQSSEGQTWLAINVISDCVNGGSILLLNLPNSNPITPR